MLLLSFPFSLFFFFLSQHTLDLRQLSQDIILKVSLPDSANKIGVTLKVVRSQTAGEVITMIHRKVNVENSHQCSLFYPAKNIWLDNSKSLEEYDIEQNVRSPSFSDFRTGLSFFFFFFFFFNYIFT